MIIPAFDLIDGQIVRLYQGDYYNQKKYNINIYKYLQEYKLKGIKTVHIVDLDGAKNSKKRQLKFLKSLLSYTDIPFLQIGGGIRTEKDINTLLEFGAKRIVVGSSVIYNKQDVKKWLKNYGVHSIVLALDIKVNALNKKYICVDGWQNKTKFTLEDILKYFLDDNLQHVLCTDISKDGTLLGPNVSLYKEIVESFKNIKFQASGGIGSLKDILSLKKTGIANVIVGRSLLEKKFHIEEALQCWQNA